jgi:hypothetical protein
MSDLFSDHKRRTLVKRLTELLEEHEAASDQLGWLRDQVDRLRIQRLITNLDQQIADVENKLR